MKNTLLFSLILVIVLFAPSLAAAQTLEFTYQGKLTAGNAPATGNYDFEFALFDASIGGSQVGAVLTRSGVAVADGVFSVQLNFGNNFFAPNRFLEIRVRAAGGAAFTILTPRQQITSSPFSIVSVNAVNAVSATTATNAEKLGGIAANQFVLTGDARLSDARSPLPGSADYIQNATIQQAASNFNISGTGTANIFSASTQFNIGTDRVLSIAGKANIFAGVSSGAANTNGSNNAFFGTFSGQANTGGTSNAFFGTNAGSGNTFGNDNAFFGTLAGTNNTIGNLNTFAGSATGFSNTSGFGNSFFGNEAGFNNTTGGNNVFLGRSAGQLNTVGNNNTIIGSGANTGSNNLSFATALGSGAVVGDSNTVVLGRTADTVRIPGNLNLAGAFVGNLPAGSVNYIQNSTTQQTASNFNISGTGRANVFNAATQYSINNQPVMSNAGTRNIFVGVGAGESNLGGSRNSFFGSGAGLSSVGGSGNSFFGSQAGISIIGASNNSYFGNQSGGIDLLSNATAIGAQAFVERSDSLVLGSINGVNNAFADTNVGIGTTAPTERLDIRVNGGNILFGSAGCVAATTVAIGLNGAFGNCSNYSIRGTDNNLYINRPAGGEVLFREGNGSTQVRIRPGGTLAIAVLGTAGSTSLCRNASNEISTCSSSMRYKSNVNPFSSGLSLIKKLRPVAFDWKAGGARDLGLVAEEVAAIEPLLTTTNEKGDVEGVKYDRVGVVLVNAVQEQQAQIEAQQKQIDEQKEIIRRQEEKLSKQQNEIDALKALVCSQTKEAEICKLRN